MLFSEEQTAVVNQSPVILGRAQTVASRELGPGWYHYKDYVVICCLDISSVEGGTLCMAYNYLTVSHCIAQWEKLISTLNSQIDNLNEHRRCYCMRWLTPPWREVRLFCWNCFDM